MEIEDMKRLWDEQNRKLDASLRLNTRILQESVLGKAATAMTRLSWLLVPELLLNFVVVVWLGSFIADHIGEARFLIPALVLDLGAMALFIDGIRQLVAILSIDYSAPIVTIQKRLGEIKVQQVRITMLTLLTAPLLWIPLLIVALKGLLNLDAYMIFSGSWLAANVAFGVAVILLGVWISRRTAGWRKRSPLVQRLMRNIGGYNLNAATGFLSSLARFEEEEERTSTPA